MKGDAFRFRDQHQRSVDLFLDEPFSQSCNTPTFPIRRDITPVERRSGVTLYFDPSRANYVPGDLHKKKEMAYLKTRVGHFGYAAWRVCFQDAPGTCYAAALTLTRVTLSEILLLTQSPQE